MTGTEALLIAGIASSAASAVGQMQAGKAQAQALAAQATMAQMQARSAALKYRQQGVEVLDKIVRTQASINAMAGAGGINPFSGSAAALSSIALSQGSQEYYTSLDNATIAQRGGELQAGLYSQQAKSAYRSGIFSAIGTLGKAAMSAGPLFAGAPAATAAGSASDQVSLLGGGSVFQ